MGIIEAKMKLPAKFIPSEQKFRVGTLLNSVVHVLDFNASSAVYGIKVISPRKEYSNQISLNNLDV